MFHIPFSEPAPIPSCTQSPPLDRSHFMHVCVECNKRYVSSTGLKKHMATHNTEKTFICPICMAAFNRKDKLTRHTKIHQPDPLQCRVCHQTCSSYKMLHSHVDTNHADSGVRSAHADPAVRPDLNAYACETCSAAFKSRDKLRRHWLVHDPSRNFKCTLCTSSFKRKDKLTRHMTIHDPVKRFPCPYAQITGCTKAFNRNDKLKAHIHLHDKECHRLPLYPATSTLPDSVSSGQPPKSE